MGFNEFISKLFGNKATRDMKEIQPWVEKVKAVYPEISKLTNDELRAKTEELKKFIKDSAAEENKKIEELKATIESTDLEKREAIFSQIDKLEKEVLEKYEKALSEVLPTAFSIVKDTARRLSENEELEVTASDFDRELAAQGRDFVRIEGDKAIWKNHWKAGGNEMTWNMVHYDVQLFGGVVLHQGKIAEMATGEGKTLVATLPVFLNALTGNGVHVVTVNDYLAKRDSEWMGPLYMFHGLSVDCIDKHQPNSEARRRAYMADITFGTNNEFGFDYLRDNMAVSPKDLVQRKHNYAIVDDEFICGLHNHFCHRLAFGDVPYLQISCEPDAKSGNECHYNPAYHQRFADLNFPEQRKIDRDRKKDFCTGDINLHSLFSPPLYEIK